MRFTFVIMCTYFNLHNLVTRGRSALHYGPTTVESESESESELESGMGQKYSNCREQQLQVAFCKFVSKLIFNSFSLRFVLILHCQLPTAARLKKLANNELDWPGIPQRGRRVMKRAANWNVYPNTQIQLPETRSICTQIAAATWARDWMRRSGGGRGGGRDEQQLLASVNSI